MTGESGGEGPQGCSAVSGPPWTPPPPATTHTLDPPPRDAWGVHLDVSKLEFSCLVTEKHSDFIEGIVIFHFAPAGCEVRNDRTTDTTVGEKWGQRRLDFGSKDAPFLNPARRRRSTNSKLHFIPPSMGVIHTRQLAPLWWIISSTYARYASSSWDLKEWRKPLASTAA